MSAFFVYEDKFDHYAGPAEEDGYSQASCSAQQCTVKRTEEAILVKKNVEAIFTQHGARRLSPNTCGSQIAFTTKVSRLYSRFGM